MKAKLTKYVVSSIWITIALFAAAPMLAQEEDREPSPGQEPVEEPPQVSLNITPSTGSSTFIEKNISFSLEGSDIPEEINIEEIFWDFGDGTQTTGENVTHAYAAPDTYTVTVRLTAEGDNVFEQTTDIRVFEHVMLLVTDNSTSTEELEIKQQQAAKNETLLLVIRSRGGNPEAVTEEDLAGQLFDARDAIQRSPVIITWTSGSVSTSVLSQFAQRIRGTDDLSFSELDISSKGIIILTDTPFAALAPTAQSVFNQINPAYVLLSRPQALDTLLEPLTPTEARDIIFESPVPHRLLGTFSARSVNQINLFNFLSVAINFLVNRGVPINNITLVLMIPVIATILSFARQFIGIKAFGLVTPAITTLSFLVMGLQYGLIVFFAVLLAGTLTRLVMRKFHLLYLPRMALVLTSVSFAILALLGFGAITENSTLLSFSIFPILILTLLAEEFIALQFKSGARRAFMVTGWTLLLAVVSYYIVSWEILRTIVVSYPEAVLLTIPINIILGRWSGLRLTEYFRFRKLLRYSHTQ